MSSIGTFSRAVRAPLLVAAAVLLGWRFPAPDSLAVVTTPLVAFLVFAAVDGVNWRSFLAGDRLSVGVVAVGLVYLLPIAFAPVPIFLLDGPMRVGTLVVLTGPPTAGSAIVWSRMGGGDAATTVLVTTAALVLAPLVTPAILGVVLGQGVSVDPVPVVRTLLLVVTGGVSLAWLVPAGAIEETTLDTLSLAAVVVLVYVGTATATVEGVSLSSLATVGLVAVGFLAFAALLASGGALIVGPERAISIFFATGLRNLGIGVAIATTLPVEGTVVAVVGFYVVQQLAAAVTAESLRLSVLPAVGGGLPSTEE
ncbi:bile acid:sodium symporter [Salinibaculum rarum]|uniref:bile acid:sodium symporter n=1 Tax=Salinibaculum rarum TaxID=3058903 RepID=UPI00265E6FD6|nr:bile acid:sodium symporter [Salinibaculum sp. KK48]